MRLMRGAEESGLCGFLRWVGSRSQLHDVLFVSYVLRNAVHAL
jgi:hypothetical protein